MTDKKKAKVIVLADRKKNKEQEIRRQGIKRLLAYAKTLKW